MPHVVIYASTQACAPVLGLALSLRAQGQLPKPLPARVASLRLAAFHSGATGAYITARLR